MSWQGLDHCQRLPGTMVAMEICRKIRTHARIRLPLTPGNACLLYHRRQGLDKTDCDWMLSTERKSGGGPNRPEGSLGLRGEAAATSARDETIPAVRRLSCRGMPAVHSCRGEGETRAHAKLLGNPARMVAKTRSSSTNNFSPLLVHRQVLGSRLGDLMPHHPAGGRPAPGEGVGPSFRGPRGAPGGRKARQGKPRFGGGGTGCISPFHRLTPAARRSS